MENSLLEKGTFTDAGAKPDWSKEHSEQRESHAKSKPAKALETTQSTKGSKDLLPELTIDGDKDLKSSVRGPLNKSHDHREKGEPKA